jgi:hypothetical protein
VRNGRKSSELNRIYRCACIIVSLSRVMLVIAPPQSSGFLRGIVWIVGVLSKLSEYEFGGYTIITNIIKRRVSTPEK